MKKVLALSAFLVAIGAAHAVTLTATLDVTGVNSVDGYFDADNTFGLFNLDTVFGADYSNYVLTGIGWDVTLTAFNNSWLSEITIGIENSDASDALYLRPAVGQNSPGTGSFSSGGVINLESAGPGLSVNVNPDDVIYIEFFEGFDDVAGAADGRWDSGTVTLQFEAVPEPATLAALGLGVAAMARRRRK